MVRSVGVSMCEWVLVCVGVNECCRYLCVCGSLGVHMCVHTHTHRDTHMFLVCCRVTRHLICNSWTSTLLEWGLSCPICTCLASEIHGFSTLSYLHFLSPGRGHARARVADAHLSPWFLQYLWVSECRSSGSHKHFTH